MEDNHKVYNAKVVALLKDLKKALKNSIVQITSKINIYLNNFNIVYNAKQILKDSSQKIFKNFEDVAKNGLKISKQMTMQ